MPETPIETDTGTHPFDADELIMVRATCTTWEQYNGLADPEDMPNLAAYAAVVMPAMADKIVQLRGLYLQHRDALTTLRHVLAAAGHDCQVSATTSTEILAGAHRVAASREADGA